MVFETNYFERATKLVKAPVAYAKVAALLISFVNRCSFLENLAKIKIIRRRTVPELKDK